MVEAAADTLHKAWRAGLNLAARAGDHPRIQSIARLDGAVLERLPPTMMRPSDLAAASLPSLEHAPALLGPVEILGTTDTSPCWRQILSPLAGHTPHRLTTRHRPVPAGLAS